jgi:hypothetical protein
LHGSRSKAEGTGDGQIGPRTLVEDIKALLGDFEIFSISHVRRWSNAVAYCLTKEGCLNKCNSVWLDSLPDFVSDLLAQDAR